jgi:hypothetical protein
MTTQVADPAVKTERSVKIERPVSAEKPKRVRVRNKRPDRHLETVYVGMLLGAALTLLGLVRKRIPV